MQTCLWKQSFLVTVLAGGCCWFKEGHNILLMGLFTVTGRLSGGIRGSKKRFDLAKASIAKLLWHLNTAAELTRWLFSTSLSIFPLSIQSGVFFFKAGLPSVTCDRWWLCGLDKSAAGPGPTRLAGRGQPTQITDWRCPPLAMRNPSHLGQKSRDSDGLIQGLRECSRGIPRQC